MSLQKEELERQLTRADRTRVFEALGFHINGHKPNDAGFITGVKGPAELGEGDKGNFSINPESGYVKDFGSSEYEGDLYQVVQDLKGLSFPEALEWIADLCGINHSAEPVTLEALARAKGFDPGFLRDRFVEELRPGLLKIRYRLEDGRERCRQRLRTALSARRGSIWQKGKAPIVPYGLWMLRKMREASTDLLLVEGESDAWTAWKHGLPALGVPGKSMTKVVEAEHLEGFERIFVCIEADEGGRHFARNVLERAETIGYSGELLALPFDRGAPDLNDLYRGNPDGFLERLAAMQAAAEPLAAWVEANVAAADQRAPEDAFWHVDNKQGRIAIDRGRLLAFLTKHGFGKIYIEDELHSTLVRVRDQVVRRSSAERIKDFVIAHIRGLSDDDAPAGFRIIDVEAALLRGANVYFSEALFEFLPVLDLDFKRDTSDTSFFYFRNCFVSVTAEGIETHPYSELDGVIWEDQVIDRDFRSLVGREDPMDWDFGRFLWNVAGEEEHRHRALMSAIGYLLHGYKDPACTKAVIFMDERISDLPSGRSGKSLVGQAIGKLVPTLRIDGKNFSFESRFAFQSVRLDTQLVEFNDVPKSFDFERLFSVISDGMQVEPKGRGQFTIPFEDSPKFLISTNYVIEGQGPSFEDRVFEIEFAPHYTKEYRPIDEFKRRFFDGWDAKEWTRFDNVMLACVRAYLAGGLHAYQHVNLKERKLRQETSPEFAEFALQLEAKEYNKKALFQSFQEAYEPDYDNLKQRTFTRWLKTYIRLYDFNDNWEQIERQSGRDLYITLQPK